MGPELVPVLIVVAGSAVVLLILSRIPDASDQTLDRTSRERIDERITELFGPGELRDSPGVEPGRPTFRLGRADPRLRLWRDTSAILMVVGIAIIVVVLVNGRPPAGAMLEATAASTAQERARRRARVARQAQVELRPRAIGPRNHLPRRA